MTIKYLGTQNEFIDGIPDRDLTDAEFDALSPALQEQAINSGLYEIQPDEE